MATQTHSYPIAIQWQGGREGSGSAKAEHSGTETSLRVPSEFGGPGGATNPEELLTTAIGGCYSITFGIVAASRRLPVVDVKTEVVGEVEQNGISFVYKKVTLKPRITVEASATDEVIAQTAEFAHKADAYCIVTNAVRGKVEIVVEPEVVRA
jgi:peroxiredoxin-like protein